MSELDIEGLMKLFVACTTEFNPPARRQLIEVMPDIIAALEGRERLREWLKAAEDDLDWVANSHCGCLGSKPMAWDRKLQEELQP